MKTLKILLGVTAALCAAVFLFALATMPPAAVRLEPGRVAATGESVVAGAYHVHTQRSDGTGTVEDIAAAAARAGLRFVIFTDHGDGTRPADPPAYRSGVLCLDGTEISTTGGHYAAFGLGPSPYPLGGETRDVVEDVRRLGGFGVAAHPDSAKFALRWRDWAAPFDGLEWLNSDSQWRDKPPMRLTHTLLEFPLRAPESLAALFGRPDTTFARFDALSRQRHVVLLAGADAHARLGFRNSTDPYREGMALRLPSYESVFRTFSLRVRLERPLAGRAAQDGLAVRDAIAAGHVYTAIDALATPPSFEFVARSGAASARGGDTLTLGGPVQVEASANSQAATIVLFENGRRVADGLRSIRYQAPERRAVFRVEVELPNAPGRPPVPWIVSNPIYVGGFLDPRTPAVRPPLRDLIPVAQGPGDWVVEREPHSSATMNVSTAGAIAFDYRLGGPAFTNQVVAIARVLNGAEAYDRVQFRASSDHPMRLSVQLRAPTPGGGGERWHRSVYLDGTVRDFTVFLDDLRPVGQTSTYKPPLARAQALLFVIDRTNAVAGSSGEVRLEEVRWGRAGN